MSELFDVLRWRLFDALFGTLEDLDGAFHRLPFNGPWWRICRFVGRMEPRYYERHTDWDHPLYVNPKTEPELYLKHAATLCAHGYREAEKCWECSE